ncbi:MAG: hypothetical protein K8I30_22015 [Anaerolineae bacterium]|nr:hypothetical protein [Anaerolineae bacterium]
MFAIACLTSPCCTPLLVPLGLALLAGTPVAVWLSAHIGWVYAGLTLLSVVSFVVALRWLNRKPSAAAVHTVRVQSIPIRSINGGSLMERTQSQPTETVIACDLTAIDAADRDQHMLTGKQLFASVTEVQELADGYAFRLPAETHILHSAAHFIANERLCCPFFDFTLRVGAKNGLWLSLTGNDDVKQFVRAEFASLVKVALP